jgi:hypothetical protein
MPWGHDPPTSTCQVAGIIAVSHYVQLVLKIRSHPFAGAGLGPQPSTSIYK